MLAVVQIGSSTVRSPCITARMVLAALGADWAVSRPGAATAAVAARPVLRKLRREVVARRVMRFSLGWAGTKAARGRAGNAAGCTDPGAINARVGELGKGQEKCQARDGKGTETRASTRARARARTGLGRGQKRARTRRGQGVCRRAARRFCRASPRLLSCAGSGRRRWDEEGKRMGRVPASGLSLLLPLNYH